MNNEEMKNFIKTQEPTFLQVAPKKINGKPSYICPQCGNGSGESGTGIARDPKDTAGHYKCFKCDLYEDIFGLWKIKYNLDDDKDVFDQVYEYYGLTSAGSVQQRNNNTRTNNTTPSAETKRESQTDYTEYFLQVHNNLNQTDYHRGLSRDTLDHFNVGYDPAWVYPQPKTNGKYPPSQRLIIPTSKYSYLARSASESDLGTQSKILKVGKTQLFNVSDLQNEEQPIFIVEGEIDAMSIYEVGGKAVGLGSTSGVSLFESYLQDMVNKGFVLKQPIIVAMDNDDAGTIAGEGLYDWLVENNFNCTIKSKLFEPYKDANEMLCKDRSLLIERMEHAKERAIAEAEEQRIQIEGSYRSETSAGSFLQEFINGISESVNTPCVPTGFNTLDFVLDGGLYEGLYIVGAISSLGKTTLALQIADQIAQQRKDVLIFSLEMARFELMSKSISRLTYLDAIKNGQSVRDAKTARGITVGAKWKDYTRSEKDLIKQACTDYGEYADHIYIKEGMGDLGVKEIREAVQKHTLITGNKPVVIVDYLQILAPANERYSDKQNTDKAVLELKRISRDFKIPVIAVSSFNRENYSEKVSMRAFKESGSIEYSSDVLIGLQLKGAGEKDFDLDKAKQENPRRVQVVILKNRNGATGKKINMAFYPMFNYFREIKEGEPIL